MVNEEYKKVIEKRLREHRYEALLCLDEQGLKEGIDYVVGGVYLRGSQNYGAEVADSDVDSNLIIYPTYRALALKKNTTFSFTISKGEQVTVKSFVDFTETFFRTNINSMEMLTTPYRIPCQFMERVREGGWLERLTKGLEKQLWATSVGMMIKRQRTLLKGTVVTKSMVEKFGYDPKDGAHVVRIFSLLNELSKGTPFSAAIWLKDQVLFDTFSTIRNGQMTQHEVVSIVRTLIEDALLKEKYVLMKNLPTFMILEQREEMLKDYLLHQT